MRVAGDYACGWGDKGVNGSDLSVNRSDERVDTASLRGNKNNMPVLCLGVESV